MNLQVAFIAFTDSDSPAVMINQTLDRVRNKFDGSGHRIINIETVGPKHFFGFQTKEGGLRIWYQTSPSKVEA